MRILYIEFWYLSSHSKHFPDSPAFLSIHCYAFFHHIKANLCCANILESEAFRWIMLNISEATVLEKTDISFLSNYQLPITTCLEEKLHALHSLWWYLIWFGLGQVVNMLLYIVLWVHMYRCPDVYRCICFLVVIHYFWLILFLILLLQMSLSLWNREVIPMLNYGCTVSSCGSLYWSSYIASRCFSDKGWEVHLLHLSMNIIMGH